MQTEINERGPEVSEQEVELFGDKLLYLAKGASMCVFAGSLPRGVDADIYARLIRELRRLGVTTVVDTDGEPLRRAVRAEPDVVSPNVLEAEELVGHEFNDDEDHLLAVREMVELGAREAIMTVPTAASPSCSPERAATARAVPGARARSVEARAAVGSGDAFLAGYVAARYSGPARAGVPALRRGLRRRVDPAPRRRRDRPGAGRAAAGEVEVTPARGRRRRLSAALRDRACARPSAGIVPSTSLLPSTSARSGAFPSATDT